MSGLVTTKRGYEWTDSPQDLIPALRLTAQPVARIDEGTVGDRELDAFSVLAIAGDVPPPPHFNYTLPGDVTVNAFTTTVLATVGGTFTLDEIICVDTPQLLILFSAYVFSISAVKILGRNTSAVNTIVPAGTVFHMVRI